MAHDQLDIAFAPWVTRHFTPAIEGYCRILLDRIDPIFEDVDGEGRHAAEEFMHVAATHTHEDDYDSVVEAAYEHGADAAMQFFEMRALFLATGVSGLFHLFEKQLYRHINRELRGWLIGSIVRWQELEDLIQKFDRKWWQNEPCMDFIHAFNDPDLQELRLVANAVKHGDEGSSYNQLVKNQAAVVSSKRIEDDRAVGPHTVFGVNISVQRADVERYRDGIVRFWRLDGTFGAPRSAFK